MTPSGDAWIWAVAPGWPRPECLRSDRIVQLLSRPTSVVMLTVVLCLLTSSDIGFAASSVSVQQSVLVDQQVLTMDLLPGNGPPVVDRSRAMTLAANYLPGAATATSVRSDYVLLTLRDASGTIARGV